MTKNSFIIRKKIVKSLALMLLSLLSFICVDSQAQDITVTGTWSETIDAVDLLDGAGSDIAPIVSSTSQLTIDLAISTSNSWNVSIIRDSATWHSDLILSAKRTSNGTGSGTISGGTSWQVITNSSTEFFGGVGEPGNRTGISVQLKLQSSITVPPDNYSSTVTFYFVEN
jgi:hypothetical protein